MKQPFELPALFTLAGSPVDGEFDPFNVCSNGGGTGNDCKGGGGHDNNCYPGSGSST